MSSISPGLRTALLERLLRDRVAGALRPCDEYARAYPGFEEAVAEEYALFTGQSPPTVALDDDGGFQAAFVRDRATGRVRPFADYLRDFPDEASKIVDRFAELDCVAVDAVAARGLEEGRRLGPYRILRCIGRGGQGDVFLAEDTRLQRNVALKVLRPDFIRRAGALERFRREAAYASRLDHPGICSVYEADTIDGAPFVAMRYVEGETLAARIRRERNADTPPATHEDLMARVALIEQAARAVQAAHDAGVLHRDLKPANLVITPDGRPVLLDFGLARAEESGDPTLTGSGDVFGTPAYMSPEQAAGAHGRVDARADVWALGVTLYELLTLELPFQAPSRGALLRQIEEKEPTDPRRLVPGIPRDLAAVVLAAIEKEIDRRYRSAGAFADDLAAIREGRPVSVVVPSLLDRALRYSRREPAKATLAAALVLALFAAAGAGGYVLARRPAIDVGSAELDRREVERAVLLAIGQGGPPRPFDPQARLRELLAANPHLGLARETLLEQLIAAGRAGEALDLTWMPPGVTPEPDEAQMMLRMRAAALRALKQDDEASVEEAKLSPEARPLEQFAAAQLEWRRFDAGDAAAGRRALEHFDRAIFLSPRAEYVFHIERARALALLDIDDRLKPRMLDSADVLVQLWPDQPVALLWAAQMIYRFDLERAVEFERRACELDPLFPDAFVMLSGAELALKNDAAAQKAYEQAVHAAMQGPPERVFLVHQNWGIGLFSMRSAESAIPPLSEAVRLAPNERIPSRYLCRAFEKAGRTAELKRELERRVDVSPDDGFAWYSLARLAFATDERDAAHAAAVEADAHRALLSQDPDWGAELDALLERLEEESARLRSPSRPKQDGGPSRQ